MSSSISCCSAILLAAGFALAGCSDSGLSKAEQAAARELALQSLPQLPPVPSNRFADDARAAALGRDLFFDTAMSANGEVACATCHLPDRAFQDDLPLGRGVGVTDRRTMPLAGAAWSPWLFWDGRKDSLWAQALGPLESPVEHAATRLGLVRGLAARHAAAYEPVFGPLPDLGGLPQSAGPFGNAREQADWNAIPPAKQAEIDRAFANIGKALEAFQRTIPVPETRFDRFVAATAKNGDGRMSETELAGLRLFVGKGECINCHNGPLFSDDHFHNTGVPGGSGLPADEGRAKAIGTVLADPFNCLGPHSDAKAEDCAELRFMSRDLHEMAGAFNTPGLRGVASRPPYMHAGQFATLEAVIDHYSMAPAAPLGHSELRPRNFTAQEKAALVAFLKTLDPE
jgi:cytochrome c peroxidase